MKYASLLAVVTLITASGQVVKPTPGALAPVNAAPAAAPASAPVATVGRTTGGGVAPSSLRRLESDFDFQLKAADAGNPFNVMGLTRGLYLPGYGVVFTTEVELVQNNINPMFTRTVTAEAKSSLHDRKLRHVDLLRKQMAAMVTNAAKNLTFLGPSDQVVVAVRLYYDAWEDKTGLPDQIVMKADQRGAVNGDIKVEVQ